MKVETAAEVMVNERSEGRVNEGSTSSVSNEK